MMWGHVWDMFKGYAVTCLEVFRELFGGKQQMYKLVVSRRCLTMSLSLYCPITVSRYCRNNIYNFPPNNHADLLCFPDGFCDVWEVFVEDVLAGFWNMFGRLLEGS